MAYKRQWKSPGTFSTLSPPNKRLASTIQDSCASDYEESSPGFETPVPRSEPLNGYSSKTQNLDGVSSLTLPPTRVSLRPPTSYFSSDSTSHAGLDDQAGESEAEGDIKRREDADSMNEIIMAVDMKERGTLGCAYYIAKEEKLCLMEDIKMAGLDIIDLLKVHVQPTILLISNRADEGLEDHLTREAMPVDRGDDDSRT